MNSKYKTKKRTYEIFLMCTLLALIGVMVILMSIFNSEISEIKVRNLEDYEMGDADDISFCIDQQMVNDENKYVVSGWLVENGKTYEAYNYGMDLTANIAYNNTKVCLIQDDSVLVLPTKMVQRDDVTDIIQDNFSHKNSGFVSCVDSEKLNMEADATLGAITTDPYGKETLYILR